MPTSNGLFKHTLKGAVSSFFVFKDKKTQRFAYSRPNEVESLLRSDRSFAVLRPMGNKNRTLVSL
jgi:hypothetical protein